MTAAFNSLANGFPILLLYLVMVTVMFTASVFIYIKLTPHREIELVQNNNMAAAISLAAMIIGLALPLAACMINRVSLMDVFIWGAAALLLQLFLFRMTDFIILGMPDRIANNEVPAATVMAAFKLAGSIILAFAIVG